MCARLSWGRGWLVNADERVMGEMGRRQRKGVACAREWGEDEERRRLGGFDASGGGGGGKVVVTAGRGASSGQDLSPLVCPCRLGSGVGGRVVCAFWPFRLSRFSGWPLTTMREGGVETRNMIRGPSPAHCGLSAFFFLPRLYISSGFLPQSTATSSNIQRFRVPVSPDSCHRPWGVSARVGGFGCGGGRGRASRPVDQRRGRCRGSATTAARFSMQGKGRGNGAQKQKRQTHRNNKMQRRDGQYVPGRGRGLECGRAGELCGTGRRGESGSGSSEGGVRRWRRDDG